MTIEAIINSLSTDQKLAAMDLLWRDLTANATGYQSPQWHGEVLSDRLTNPSPEPKLGLADAEDSVRSELNARRNQK